MAALLVHLETASLQHSSFKLKKWTQSWSATSSWTQHESKKIWTNPKSNLLKYKKQQDEFPGLSPVQYKANFQGKPLQEFNVRFSTNPT